LEEVRATTEFSFGVGFGRLLKEIKKITQTDNGWDVEGKISFQGAIQDAHLSIDRDFLVRSARIVWIVKDGTNTKFIETTGTVTTGGVVLAEAGTFRQVLHQNSPPEGKQSPDFVNLDLNVAFEKFTGNLTNEQFDRMVRAR
jgi:hypothetical protein